MACAMLDSGQPAITGLPFTHEEITMWTKPSYNDIRLGFEITMYFKAD